MKLNFKFLITTFALFLILSCSICYATNNYETMLISDTNSFQESTTIDSDLYITDSEYEINNTINGNVYSTVDNLNINSSGRVNGNLFVTANNVHIKSDVIYSDTAKDELGNSVITINNASSISGNAFIITDKFVLDPGCKIDGDLYILANEVCLEQNSKIDGNVFVYSNNIILNSEINGTLYAVAKTFDMQYFAFISRDLHLTAEEINLNGWIYRNSYITAKNISTLDKFINQGNFTLKDANTLVFSGEILGNASLNTKNINFKSNENDNNLTCKISGNLSYSSNSQIEIPEGIVTKEVSYNNYKSTTSNMSILRNQVLNLITLLFSVYVIYIIISKFTPKFLNNFSNISGLNLLKYLGIGLGLIILIPIVSIHLIMTSVGILLGIILLLFYIIMLIIAKPIFIISIAKFAKDKLSYKFNIYLYILLIAVILSLLSLIPVVRFIISILVILIGFGMIIRR